MADGADRTNPTAAMVELALGLATLCGITLDHLADRSGPDTGPRDLLAAIRDAYVTDPV